MSEGWATSNAIDFSSTSKDGPTPPPDDVYQAQIVAAEPEETRKGDPGFKVVLELIADYSGNTEYARRKVYDKCVATQAGDWKLAQLGDAAGIERLASGAYGDVQAYCERLVAAPPVFIKTAQETYNGKTNAKVKRYLTPDEAAEAMSSSSSSNGASQKRKRR